MALNIGREIAILNEMTVGQLREKYREVFGEPTRAGNRDFLFKRIAWRMQANADGDLTERARRRAEELANDADLRLSLPPKGPEVPEAHRCSGSLLPPSFKPPCFCDLRPANVLAEVRDERASAVSAAIG